MGAERPLIFDFGDLKLCDLTKLCFFKLIMTKSNFKKPVMTSSLIRHRKRHQTNVTRFFHFEPFSIKISGYVNVYKRSVGNQFSVNIPFLRLSSFDIISPWVWFAVVLAEKLMKAGMNLSFGRLFISLSFT